MGSPVWGLRAVRALRLTRSKDKKPDRTIFSPLDTPRTTTSSKDFRTSATVFLAAPLSATIASTNSALFTGQLLFLFWTTAGRSPGHHAHLYRQSPENRGFLRTLAGWRRAVKCKSPDKSVYQPRQARARSVARAYHRPMESLNRQRL